MKARSPFQKVTLILVIALFLLLCPLGLFSTKAFALSIEDERAMGQELLSQVRAYFEFLDDPFADRFINYLGQYLILPVETKFFPFHFYIIKGNDLNAFAGPGGHIFVFSGLIEVMDTVDELAAVLCHEIGHVTARHIAKRIAQAKNIGLAQLAGALAAILLGGEAAAPLLAGTMAAGIQAQLHYSREDERQSDQLSFKYMKPSGFAPDGMISSLKKIEKGSWFGTDKIPSYLLTHPTGPERMSNLDAMLSNYTPGPLKKEAEQLRALFPILKTVVSAKCLAPNDAERLFRRQSGKAPDAYLPHLGLGIVYMRESEYAKAIQELKKSLVAKPDFAPVLRTLGEAYQMNGQDEEALRILQKALLLDDEDIATQYLIGLSYENMGQYKKAIRLFERLASFSPVKNEVYYHLGISYGRLERLGLAHYYFGRYFMKLGQYRKASFHFQKANGLSGKSPTLRKKIQKETNVLKKIKIPGER